MERITEFAIDNKVALSLAIATICGYLIQRQKWSKLPPGPLGLPILGYIPFISLYSHRDFVRLSKYYKSNIISVRLGSDLAVM